MAVHPSICRVCPAHCPILVTVEGGRATKVVGDRENPLYEGYSCPKGRALPAMHDHPGRLLSSLARGADGALHPISSDDVVARVAERTQAILDAHGPRAVAMYVGTNALPYPASPVVASAWHRAIGSRMFFTSNTIDQPGKQLATAIHGGWHAGMHDFARCDAWLVVGQNPVVSKSAGVPIWNPARQIVRAVRRGLALVVVDPRRTETARHARVHLQARPGEDPVLLAAMLHVIFDEGLADAAFVAETVDGAAELARAVEPVTPALAARRADVPEARVVEAARILGRAERAGATCGTGPSFATHGTLTEALALSILSVCGLWPRAGEVAPRPNAMLPAFAPRAQPYAPYRASGFGEKLRVRGLASCAAGMPTAALADEILEEGEGRVRALFVLGGNPMMAWPDQARAQRALEKLDLLVTCDPELSATARLADFVVAPRLTLETPGMTLPAENLKYFGPAVGFTRPWAQYAPALVEPPAGADLLEEWRFYYRLARAMKLELTAVNFYGWGKHVESPPVPWALDMQREPTTDELYDRIAAGGRVPLDEVKRHPRGRVFDEDPPLRVGPREPACDSRLQVGDPDLLRELADVVAAEPAPDPALPFRLLPRRANAFINSTGRSLDVLTHGRPWNPAYLHPDDLAALGVAPGDTVRIRSRHAAVAAVAGADDGLRRGTVSMTHAFGGLPGDDDDPRALGTNAGRLLDAADEYDPRSGMPRMGALPVSVEPIATASR